jgi:hypothetical protein
MSGTPPRRRREHGQGASPPNEAVWCAKSRAGTGYRLAWRDTASIATMTAIAVPPLEPSSGPVVYCVLDLLGGRHDFLEAGSCSGDHGCDVRIIAPERVDHPADGRNRSGARNR